MNLVSHKRLFDAFPFAAIGVATAWDEGGWGRRDFEPTQTNIPLKVTWIIFDEYDQHGCHDGD